MSELHMPHPDELIDHEAEWLDYPLQRDCARSLSRRWPDEPQRPNPLSDPDSWPNVHAPLRDGSLL